MQSVTDAEGKTHLPGDVVELPASYLGERWLEPVEEEPKPVAPAAKVESAPETVPAKVPFEAKKSRKTK